MTRVTIFRENIEQELELSSLTCEMGCLHDLQEAEVSTFCWPNPDALPFLSVKQGELSLIFSAVKLKKIFDRGVILIGTAPTFSGYPTKLELYYIWIHCS